MCLKVVSEALSWEQAQENCKELGGRLAEPVDIKKFMLHYDIIRRGSGSKYIFYY